MNHSPDGIWHVWRALQRKEEELSWGGRQFSSGREYDSLGRRAESFAQSAGGWAVEQMGRVDRVRKALDQSGPLARSLVMQTLEGIDLSSIWPVLLAACKDIAIYYGGSVITGGVIGGVGGAFFGGVGAVPGAAGGAALGGYVGGWVLALLGLKSLAEGLMQAIPDALRCYEQGFSEAWGPVPEDTQQGIRGRLSGNPSLAAFKFADGHVLMVSAILAAIVAYLSRGKGDKLSLLNEIRQSPRLGPSVARWVEVNESKLMQSAMLRPRQRGAASTTPQPAARSRRGKNDPPAAPKGMPQVKVPCFKTKGLPQGKFPEFDRQLAGQEAGLNNMTVNEYLQGRAAFKSGASVRDAAVARDARAIYRNNLKDDLFEKFLDAGMSNAQALKEAEKGASSTMKTLAALHNPDMVAAGKDKISDFGDRGINSRIGAQWNKRLIELDRAANAVSAALRGTQMNAKLERCK